MNRDDFVGPSKSSMGLIRDIKNQEVTAANGKVFTPDETEMAKIAFEEAFKEE